MNKGQIASLSKVETNADIGYKKYGFWRGFADALLGPKSRISGLRRRFTNRSWSTRLSFILIGLAIISGFATYAALTETPPFGDDPHTVIWLLNIDLVILLFLVILIARRIVSIWSGRRRNIAGSRLHVRLVLTFSIMAALPAIIMAVFSAFFFHFGVQTWFNDTVKTAVYESQAVAEAYLEEHQQLIKADILAMANDIDRQSLRTLDSQEAYDRLLHTQAFLRNFSESIVFNSNGQILARSGLTFTLTFETVPDFQLDQARDGEVVLLTSDADDRVRALVQLGSGNNDFLFVGRRVDPTVLSYLTSAKDATQRYATLEDSFSGLQVTVTMIFIVVALLLLMAAMWAGIVLARQLVSPISTLISVSDRVRAGDLTARVPKQDQVEEFDYLAQSFNRMTSQLESQRDELVTTNRQLDQRRQLTETVLKGVPAGVMGVDQIGQISFANDAAAILFEAEGKVLIDTNISDHLPEIKILLEEAYKNPEKIAQSEVPFTTKNGNKLSFIVRIAIENIQGGKQRAILTFDDITELQSAQRKAAWADVARRIAHEIKNPLTPIQLSAERLQRKYLSQITDDPETFEVCTDTIIRHVEDIGRMVNEFSDFARMPESKIQPTKLVKEIHDLVMFQNAAHPEIAITIQGNADKNKPVPCDNRQIRQALTNLIQNAVDSIQSYQKDHMEHKGKIIITLEEGTEIFKIHVQDNGLGLPENEEPSKLSEPYITHREKGTGLGLAIVKKIMSDHNGELLINRRDDAHRGACISLLLPDIVIGDDEHEKELKRA